MPRARAKRFISRGDARRLENALATLADFDSEIVAALIGSPRIDGGSRWDHVHVCAAIRALIDDGWAPSGYQEASPKP